MTQDTQEREADEWWQRAFDPAYAGSVKMQFSAQLQHGGEEAAAKWAFKQGLRAALQDTRAEPAWRKEPLTNLVTDALDGYRAGLAGEPMGFVSEAFDCGWYSGDNERRTRAESTPPTGDELHHELDGVIADVEAGNGFDAVCLKTVKRVRDALAEGRRQDK